MLLLVIPAIRISYIIEHMAAAIECKKKKWWLEDKEAWKETQYIENDWYMGDDD